MHRKISLAGLLALLTAASTAFAQDIMFGSTANANGTTSSTVVYPNNDGPVYSATSVSWNGMTGSVVVSNTGQITVDISATGNSTSPNPANLTISQGAPGTSPVLDFRNDQNQSMGTVSIYGAAGDSHDNTIDVTVNGQPKTTLIVDNQLGTPPRPQLKTQHQEYRWKGTHREWRVTGGHYEPRYVWYSENIEQEWVEDGEWVDVDDYEWVWVDDDW